MMKTQTRIQHFSFLVCIFLSQHVVYSQNRLVDLKGGGYNWGGRAGSVCVNPLDSNEIWIASDGGGLYFSTNGGATWRRDESFPGVVSNNVKICPNNPDIIIATCAYDSKTDRHIGVWRSRDHGGTWSKPDSSIYSPDSRCPVQCGATGIDWVPGSHTVYVTTDCGLIKSTNDGADWSEVTVNTGAGGNDYWDRWRTRPDRMFEVLAIDETHVIVGGEAAEFYTTDGGSTWNRCGDSIPDFYCMHAFSFVPGNSNWVFRANYNTRWIQYSTDYGITWQFFSPNAASYFLSHQTPSDWYRSADGIIPWMEYSADAGVTWQRSGEQLLATGNMPPFTKVTSSPLGSNYFELYFGNGVDFYRATLRKDPATWTSAVFNHLTTDHEDQSDICFNPRSGRPLVLTGDWGISKTTDDGRSWHSTGAGSSGYNALQVYGLEVQEAQDAPHTRDINFITWHNDTWASTDDGVTWQHKWPVEGSYITGNGPVLSHSADVRNAVRPVEELVREVGRSMDETSPAFIPPQNPDWERSINYFNDPVDGKPYTLVITRGERGVIYYDKKIPSASSWTSIMRDSSVVPMSFPVFATTGTQVHAFFIDFSNTLFKVWNINGTNPTITMLNSSTIGRIGMSRDANGKFIFAVKPDDPQIMIASDISAERVKRSTDGGTTWQPLNTLNSLVTANGGNYYTIVPYQYYAHQGTQQVFDIAFSPFNTNIVVVGTYENGLFISYDAGEIWDPIWGTEDIPMITEIHFGSDNDLYVGSWGRGVWKYNLNYFVQIPEKYYPKCEVCVADPTTGVHVPISIIGDPEKCPACQLVLAKEGEIIRYVYDQKLNVMTLTASKASALYFYQDGKAMMGLQVLQSETQPLISQTKKSHCCIFKKKETKQNSSAPLKGLIMNEGKVVAEIRDVDGKWKLPEEFFTEAFRGKSETQTDFKPPQLEKPKYDMRDIKQSKAVMIVGKQDHPGIMQGSKIIIIGGKFPQKSEVHFYADGILLPKIAVADAKGNFEYPLDLTFLPGPLEIVALFNDGNELYKAKMNIFIRDYDHSEVKK